MPDSPEATPERHSRRTALKRIGAGAAIAWSGPILISLKAPAFAQYFFDCDFGPCSCLPGGGDVDVCGIDQYGDCWCGRTFDHGCQCAQLPEVCGEECFSDADCTCPNCYCFNDFCYGFECRESGSCRAVCHTP